MSLLFENQFGEIIYNSVDNMLEVHWKDTTEELEDEDFQSFLVKFTEVISMYSTSAFFVNATKKMFVMSNPIQEWHDVVIVPKYIEAGIRKIAFHVGDNTMVDLSLELTFDEENSQQLQTKFFDDEEKARTWLLEKKTEAA